MRAFVVLGLVFFFHTEPSESQVSHNLVSQSIYNRMRSDFV